MAAAPAPATQAKLVRPAQLRRAWRPARTPFAPRRTRFVPRCAHTAPWLHGLSRTWGEARLRTHGCFSPRVAQRGVWHSLALPPAAQRR